VKYKVQITWEDYDAAMQAKSPAERPQFQLSRTGRVIIWVLYLVILGFWALNLGSGENEWFFWVLLCLGAARLLTGLLGRCINKVVTRKRRAHYDQMKEWHVPCQWEFTDDGWSAVSQYSRSFFSWAMFHSWCEVENCILLYKSDLMFHFIPKRIFGRTDEVERLRAILVKGIGNRLR